MLMEDNDSYYYDFYGLEERVSSIGTQISEVHEDVKIVETQISELVSVHSEQFSELMSVQSEQVSEIVSVMNDNSLSTTDIMNQALENQSEILVTNMLICGLLGLIIGICFVNIFKSR